MSVENVKKFYEAISQEEALKQQMVELSLKYQGQPMDEAAGLLIMKKEILPTAAKMGYSFTTDDVAAYSKEMQANCELSDEELQVVTGGTSGNGSCNIIGVGSGDFYGYCIICGTIYRDQYTCAECFIFGNLVANKV